MTKVRPGALDFRSAEDISIHDADGPDNGGMFAGVGLRSFIPSWRQLDPFDISDVDDGHVRIVEDGRRTGRPGLTAESFQLPVDDDAHNGARNKQDS